MKNILKILRLGHPILRQVAEPFPKEEITSKETKELVSSMVETLHKSGGVGLAAPQVGVSKQLVIVEVPNDLSPEIQPIPLTVIFNPQIEFFLKHEKIQMWESCLSIPGFVGKVTRYNNVIMHFLGHDGKKKRIAATGFLAGVIQHETDHLWGKLFIDRLTSLKDLAFEEEWRMFHSKEEGISDMGSFKMYDLE